jgi:UDP-N-acetylmuramoyl-L-alanyl-D-glutamate--2,6-diaminopimelate ligase
MCGGEGLRLTELLKGSGIQVALTSAIERTNIIGLTSDSRRVEAGFLFAALPGSRLDGCAFIGDAIRRGAAAVLAPPGTRLPEPVDHEAPPPPALITDDNPRRHLALMAARFFARQPATVAAVTGTNGKTSVVTFLRQIWSMLGLRAASMGTLGISAPDIAPDIAADIALGIGVSGSLTTPDPVALHHALAQLADADVRCLALEASSHGLEQNRLDGVRITAAAFTNLSRDHLDYHQSMDAYFAAKRRLMAEILADGGTAVLNADIAEFAPLAESLSGRDVRIMTFGWHGGDIRLDAVEALAHGQRLTISIGSRMHQIVVPLVGTFQATNALCALALAIATGADPAAAVMSLASLEGVRGRMQRAGRRRNGSAVYVDYAHTPDALRAVLSALRPHVRDRLAVVFGCGGDRDRGKRREMGKIAAELADDVIVTDDNPRSEDPAAIRRQILEGCPAAREIGDRREAITHAVAALAAGDLLVVAGKGHETGQIIGGTVVAFDDVEAVQTAIAEADG